VDYLYEIKKNPFKSSDKKTGQRSVWNEGILRQTRIQGFKDSRIQGAKCFFSNDFINALSILSKSSTLLEVIQFF